MAKGRSSKKSASKEEGTTKKEKKVSETNEPEEEEVRDDDTADGGGEMWDIVRVIGKDETVPCMTDGCEGEAVATWVSNLAPDDKWHSCEECQENDFGGWPEEHSPEDDVSAPNESCDEMEALEDSLDEKKDGNKQDDASKNEKATTDTVAVTQDGSSDDDAGATSNGGNADESSASGKKDDKSNDKDESMEDAEEDEDEQWDLKKILSHSEIMRECPIKCGTDDCRLVACCLYVSSKGEKWYTCLDCQENDYDGWPPLEELPIKSMSHEHKQAITTKSSKWKSPAMPKFADDEASPSKVTNAMSTNTVTPPPNSLVTEQTVGGGGKGKKVTPTPGGQKMSANAVKMHRQWQEAAIKAGGPDARIVVNKPKAKPLIFDVLYDAFRPMNITQIHNALKATVPSPVLRSCLDEMALDKKDNPFDEDSDDDEDDDKGKKAKAKSDDPYVGSLAFKAGRNANTCLYYVDHTKQKNNGDGLEPDQRNELMSDVAKAEEEMRVFKANLQRTNAEATQLLSEPTNEELDATLEEQERAMTEIRAKLEEARKLKVNEAHKKKTQKRISNMAQQWRKRKRLCIDFLITAEEMTDGAISYKKCLKGDGQIDIESDEVGIANSIAYGKKKKSMIGNGKKVVKKKRVMGKSMTGKEAETSVTSGITASEDFVAVELDSKGDVCRVYLNDER